MRLHLQGAEGLFDALTWYFPMAFTPPPVNKCAAYSAIIEAIS